MNRVNLGSSLFIGSIFFALLNSCSLKETHPQVILTYACCDTTCLDSAHLSSVEEYDPKGRLTKRIEYVEESPEPYRVVRNIYADLGILERTDSTQYSMDSYQWDYDQGRPIKQTIIKSWLTVVNEIPDTIPHTEWRWLYDTSFVHYHYQKNQLVRTIHLQGVDTLSIVHYRYGANHKVQEVEEGSLKWKLYYNSLDSLVKKEKWSYTGSSSNDQVRWQLLETWNRKFNDKGQLAEVEITDEFDITIESQKFLYQKRAETGKVKSQETQEITVLVCHDNPGLIP